MLLWNVNCIKGCVEGKPLRAAIVIWEIAFIWHTRHQDLVFTFHKKASPPKRNLTKTLFCRPCAVVPFEETQGKNQKVNPNSQTAPGRSPNPTIHNPPNLPFFWSQPSQHLVLIHIFLYMLFVLFLIHCFVDESYVTLPGSLNSLSPSLSHFLSLFRESNQPW